MSNTWYETQIPTQPGLSWSLSSLSLSSFSPPAMVTSLLFLKHTKHIPFSGFLCLVMLLPECFSLTSSNATSPGQPSMTALSNKAWSYPVSMYDPSFFFFIADTIFFFFLFSS